MTKLLTRWKKPDQMNTHTLCTTQWGSLKDPHSTAPVNSCRAKWSNPINRPATRAWATPPAPLRPRVYLLNHEELTKTVLLNCVQRCGKVETLCIYRMTFSTFHGLHLVVVVVLDVTLKSHCQLRVFVVDLVNELQHLLPSCRQSAIPVQSCWFGFCFAIGNEELPEVDASISRHYRDIDRSADVMSVL